MNSFSKSTHFKNWIKTEEEIKKIEKSKIEKILSRIYEINLKIQKENEEKCHEKGTNNENFQKCINTKKYINLEKEKIVIINFSFKLIKMLNSQKNKSTSLKNITLSYFRRFFLKKSILDFDPIYLMGAALFLGNKVAQLNLSILEIEKLFPILKNNEKKLFDYEFFLATILDYNFYVYNPYQAFYGLIFTLEQKDFFLAQKTDNFIDSNEFKQGCIDIIDKMFLTDNIFLFTYSEIALASIFIKCLEKNININKVAEKIEIDKIINIKEFMEGPLEKMKHNLELLKEYENFEEQNKKANEIYKITLHFHKKFPQYQTKLDEERKIIKNKMKSFSEDFDELLKKKGLLDKKK